jgi:hypothetical protein
VASAVRRECLAVSGYNAFIAGIAFRTTGLRVANRHLPRILFAWGDGYGPVADPKRTPSEGPPSGSTKTLFELRKVFEAVNKASATPRLGNALPVMTLRG